MTARPETPETPEIEGLLREAAPQALGVLVRRYGRFGACDDAVQEALLAAAVQWPRQGVPDRPVGWLITVASRRLADQLRVDEARRRREHTVAGLAGPLQGTGGVWTAADTVDAATATEPLVAVADHDDTLLLLFLCCHPALTVPTQLALTLRAVGGLTTAEVARALLVPEATMAQRISRAKQRIRKAGARFEPPSAGEWGERLRVVLHVLYLMFNEGYAATSGPDASRPDLTGEAIRLTRAVHRLLPDEGEVTGLLALMVLTEARRGARIGSDGNLVPLTDQDRSRWDQALVEEGTALITSALQSAPLGPYQLQAAIAAVHAEAATADETDWRQIAGLYELLDRLAPSPVVTLNRAVAVAMVDGPRTGLDMLAPLDDDERLADHHRLAAVRAHLHELAGDKSAAAAAYGDAARRTTSLSERRYLEAQHARLTVSDAADER